MAKLIEKYDVVTDNMKIEVDILEEEKEFVRVYFVNIPEYGPGTKALLSSLKGSLITDSAIQTERMLDPAFIGSMKEKFRERAEKTLKAEFPRMDDNTKQILIGMLLEEMLGLGKVEFLISDGNLEEIVVNSAKDPIWVYHKKYGWLKTNLFLDSEAEIQNYASIIARRVGKQITTLNPLLDAHLITGDRANSTLFPISSRGNTITIRRFRRDPWTVTDLVENHTASLEVMSLLWIAIQYELNILFSGGTASGKTTLLNVCMPFIQPFHRILTLEDSVLPETEILCEKNNSLERTTVGEIIDNAIGDLDFEDVSLDNNFGLKVFSMNKKGKIELCEPSKLYRHKVCKKVINIDFESGKRISVTADHSLFGLGRDGEIREVSGLEIKKGSFLAVPRILDYSGQKVVFDLREHLAKLSNAFIQGDMLKIELRKNKALLREHLSKPGFNASCRKGLVSASLASGITVPEDSVLHGRVGTKMPLLFEVDEVWATFFGLWLADGCYDKSSVLVSVVEPECRRIVEEIAARLEIPVKMHSDGITLILNSVLLKQVMQEVFGLHGSAYTKRIPSWAFGLQKKEAAALLRGYFSGDGWQRKFDTAIRSASLELLKDTQTMLLRFGIQMRFKRKRLKDKTFKARISETGNLKKFFEEIGFLQNKKMQKLSVACKRARHEVSDIVPLQEEDYFALKKELKKEVGNRYTYKSWKCWGQRYKKGNISRSRLKEILQSFPLLERFKPLAENDLFWDKVERVQEREYSGFVYDFSVPENESFVCESIVCHNTRELVLPDFLHWVPLTTREANPEGRGEVSMLDLLVNSLRMRPDRIIVGETRRQREAEVMFEAMHTGHSVYTTIHANTSDETIRRLTTPPVSIPKSSLDAVHLNVVMFRNRRIGARRILQVSEFIEEKRSENEERINANVLYRWRPSTDSIEKHQDSIRLFDELAMHTGFSPDELNKDLKDKQKILEWMSKQKIRDIQSVGRVMASYYLDPENVLKQAVKNQKFELFK